MNTFLRKRYKAMKRWVQKRKIALSAFAIIFVIGGLAYTDYMSTRKNTVDPSTYTQLLNLIADAESNGNYNAYFGNSRNTTIDFTGMTINDVLKWQAEYVQQGNYSSAIGRYQIINTTLSGLVQRLGINPQQKFDQTTQDNLAIALLERRGSEKYVNDELTREEFAANLAKEWAALPKVIGEKPHDSYYASDGVNKSRVQVDEVLKAIEPIGPK